MNILAATKLSNRYTGKISWLSQQLSKLAECYHEMDALW